MAENNINGAVATQEAPVSKDDIILMMREIIALREQVNILTAGAPAKKNGLGGKKVAKAVLDTKTGIVYHARSAAGMAVCSEYKDDKGKPLSATQKDGTRNSFVWYSIPEADRKARFKDLTTEQYNAAKAEQDKKATADQPKAETPAEAIKPENKQGAKN